MLLHLSQFCGYLLPLAGMVAPIAIWLMMKDGWPEMDAHGRNVANWILSAFIYGAIGAILFFLLIGVPLLIVLGVLGVVYPIVGAVKASNGVAWHYPGSIRFF